MLTYTLAAGVALVSAQDTTVTCPPAQGGRTFQYHSGIMSWDQAEQYCMSTYGGHLASVMSAEENTCISSTVLPQTPDAQAWIGLSDDIMYSPAKMDFRWVDNPNAQPSYFNWNAGEPADSDERCGRMYSAGLGGTIGGTWNNDLCSKYAAFVCGPSAPTPPPTPPPPTPDASVTCVLGGRKFKYFAEQVTWAQAIEKCKDWEPTANLASIHSASENSCLATRVIPQGPDDQAWIGLTDDLPYSAVKMEFLWTDSSEVDFFNWNDGEPADSEERCGRMYGAGMGGLGGKWNNDLCTKTAPYVCQIHAPATPPPSPGPEACPGAQRTGTFDYLPNCPDDFSTPMPDSTLNELCDSWCESSCSDFPRKRGMISLGSPFGNSSTCVCYTRLFGDRGLTRSAYGGCQYKSANMNEVLSSDCSKGIWHQARTRFIEDFEIGMGFGPPADSAPFGNRGYTPDQFDSGATFNNDQVESWDACLGVPEKGSGDPNNKNPDAPCYNTQDKQDPSSCKCVDNTEGSMFGHCNVLGGSGCAVGVTFTAQDKKSWSASELVNGCFPSSCTNKDIKAISQYVVNEWVPNATGTGTYRLTSVDVPATCGKGGGSPSGGSSNAGAIAGGVIGACVVLGLGGFLFMKFKGRSSGGGLGRSLVANKRGTLF